MSKQIYIEKLAEVPGGLPARNMDDLCHLDAWAYTTDKYHMDMEY